MAASGGRRGLAVAVGGKRMVVSGGHGGGQGKPMVDGKSVNDCGGGK